MTLSQTVGLGLDGKRAMVFGSGPGMGLACIDALASAGCRLVCVDIDVTVAATAADSVVRAGREGVPLACDARDRSSVASTFETAVARLGGLDIVVNIIGASRPEPFTDITDESWDSAFSLNLRQAFLTTQHGLRHLRERGGAVVLMSSIAASSSAATTASYGAAKAGIESLTRSAALDGAGHGIRVNAVAPGLTRTPRLEGLIDGPSGRSLAERIPLGRSASPTEIAGVVLFFASDLSSYVTGQTLVVDGGATLSSALSLVSAAARTERRPLVPEAT